LLGDTLTWQPDPGRPSLTLDLAVLFRDVLPQEQI
jgi:hypothetical protein